MCRFLRRKCSFSEDIMKIILDLINHSFFHLNRRTTMLMNGINIKTRITQCSRSVMDISLKKSTQSHCRHPKRSGIIHRLYSTIRSTRCRISQVRIRIIVLKMKGEFYFSITGIGSHLIESSIIGD